VLGERSGGLLGGATGASGAARTRIVSVPSSSTSTPVRLERGTTRAVTVRAMPCSISDTGDDGNE
jgi:hypothetical protein